tara:strand:- start:126 stop:503 length:378 start_codon:yes stop_codon:yes gene_type:complete
MEDFSFIMGISFAIIDSGIFILAEEYLDKLLIIYTDLDHISRPVLLGGCAAAIALLFSRIIEHYYMNDKYIRNSPLTDSLAIIFGTIIVIFLYMVYKNTTKQELIIKTRYNRDKNNNHILDENEI